MIRIVNPNDMTRWDRSQMDSGVSSRTLMARAAEGLSDAVCRIRNCSELVTCICGSGNNGGDGIALSCILAKKGIPARVVLAANINRMSDDSLYYLGLAKALHVPVSLQWEPVDNEILIDALFGIGLNRSIEGKFAELIECMNNSGKRILSADIPSGLNAATGEILGVSVNAEETVTMQYPKTGMFLRKGPAQTGRLTICNLGSEIPFNYSQEFFWQEYEDVQCMLPPRPFDSHKGQNGHALLFVGSNRYIGAALLSSKAALRSGCGLLSVCVPDSVRPAFSTLPEAITISAGSSDWDRVSCLTAIQALVGKSSVGIGCGIGSVDISPLLHATLISGIPTVLDADALNCLSRNRYLLSLLHEKVVITPHAGEMARLLNCSVNDVLSDPLSCVKSFPCVTLLKGPTTLVSDGKVTWFCTEGTPALAKGGSGDVLTGIITALLSQGMAPLNAARVGTFLLGTNARRAISLLGERVLIASDVIEALNLL